MEDYSHAFYTSINNNYLPKARVLAKSLKNIAHIQNFL